jgi:hypothetical protein
MKKTAPCLASILLVLLSTATLLHAAEQKIVFNTESLDYESGTNAKKCQEMCRKRSGPDARSLFSEGWKIISSSPKEVIGEEYWYVPCNSCEPHGCTCIGTEYVLQRDEPAARVETSGEEPAAPDKDERTELYAPKGEAPVNELDLLRKKNELLIQEIISLKQENEYLRNQLRSERK